MMYICRFMILAKQTQREFDFVNKHIVFLDAIPMCLSRSNFAYKSEVQRRNYSPVTNPLCDSKNVVSRQRQYKGCMIINAENPMARNDDSLIVKPIFSRYLLLIFWCFWSFLIDIIDINSMNVSIMNNGMQLGKRFCK